jgi:hypothetical protein
MHEIWLSRPCFKWIENWGYLPMRVWVNGPLSLAVPTPQLHIFFIFKQASSTQYNWRDPQHQYHAPSTPSQQLSQISQGNSSLFDLRLNASLDNTSSRINNSRRPVDPLSGDGWRVYMSRLGRTGLPRKREFLQCFRFPSMWIEPLYPDMVVVESKCKEVALAAAVN